MFFFLIRLSFSQIDYLGSEKRFVYSVPKATTNATQKSSEWMKIKQVVWRKSLSPTRLIVTSRSTDVCWYAHLRKVHWYILDNFMQIAIKLCLSITLIYGSVCNYVVSFVLSCLVILLICALELIAFDQL